jgi:hypothetical protein
MAGGKVLLGNSDGTFQPARDSGLVIYPAALADCNRDSRLDALSGGSYQLGNGDGTFQPVHTNSLYGSGHDYNGAAAFGTSITTAILTLCWDGHNSLSFMTN